MGEIFDEKCSSSDLGPDLDAVNVWDALLVDAPTDRAEVLHNIDDLYGNAALTVGDWKLLLGTTYGGKWDRWYGPAGDRNASAYNMTEVSESPVAKALSRLGRMPTVDVMHARRREATLKCDCVKRERTECNLMLGRPCLFDVANDPCELDNLADMRPDVVRRLMERLAEYNATALPPANLPLDERADPKYWNGTWTNFGDYV